MTNKELFYFAGKCLSLDDHPEFVQEIVRLCKSELIDWQRFVELCNGHLILPLVYLKFRSYDLLRHLPEELATHLEDIFELNYHRNKQILQQLDAITRTLNKHGVEPLFLKGAAYLLDGLYSNIGERILSDIDFLVQEKDYLLSAKLLENEGYEMVEPFSGDIATEKHYPRLYHPDYISIVEIHRLPVKKDYQHWFNTGLIETEKKPVGSLSGCYVPSDNHKIVHNFIHSQLANEGYLYGTVSFRDLYDLYLLSKRTDLSHTVEHIKSKQKAVAYFAFARLALGLDETFYPHRNFNFRVLTKKHSLNHQSRFFYTAFRSAIFIPKRIFGGYVFQFLKSLYSKEMRRSIARRLRNPRWYKDHFNFYKRFFSN